MNFSATLAPVGSQGSPPVDFLESLISWGKIADASIFEPVDRAELYSALAPYLGPFDDVEPYWQRRAAMLEAMRVHAGFESSWNWSQGVDTSAGQETPQEMETGIFQVSADSLTLAHDGSLIACVGAYCPDHSIPTFLAFMKSQHAFALEYYARLVRWNLRWAGPYNRGWVQAAVSRDAMAEFEALLQAS
jgi:hypothetical protein